MSRGTFPLRGDSPRRSTLLALALTLLIPTGCAPPAPSGSGNQVAPARLATPFATGLFVGCWSLTWLPVGASPPDAGELPDSISLREGAVFGTNERLLSPATHPNGRVRSEVVGGPDPWESVYRLNRWWVEGDVLSLRFSDGGEEAWLVHLREQGGGLDGRSWRGPDAGPEDAHRAVVRGSRIECEFG